MMVCSSPRMSGEKRPWWVGNRKVIDKYIRESRVLMATQDPQDVSFAVSLLDAALAISPLHETSLELKSRCLLFLRRFRDVAHMLKDYIPTYKPSSPEDDSSSSSDSFASCSSSSSSSSSSSFSREERAKLLGSMGDVEEEDERSLKCFSMADLKKKVIAGVCKNVDREGQWRYMVLGEACFHLGMMEDALVLLQTFRRLSINAFRRESLDLPDDDFVSTSTSTSLLPTFSPLSSSQSSLQTAIALLTQIKLLLRRRCAAVASLDAGLHSEAIRHFNKILDSRRGIPQAFLAHCYIGRASAYRAAGRLADSIADCNRALSLDPTSISALRSRADVLESIQFLPDCLRDLDHLKLLYDAILRDGTMWRPNPDIHHSDIAGSLRALMVRIQEMRKRVGNCDVDYYGLIGVRRGCKRSELQRAHLLLSIKHRPEKAAAFVDRVEFSDEHRYIDAVRDQARMSALVLYRMVQKGYSTILSAIIEDERRAATAPAVVVAVTPPLGVPVPIPEKAKAVEVSTNSAVYRGVFCRDLAVVGGLLSRANSHGRSMPVKYETLSC